MILGPLGNAGRLSNFYGPILMQMYVNGPDQSHLHLGLRLRPRQHSRPHLALSLIGMITLAHLLRILILPLMPTYRYDSLMEENEEANRESMAAKEEAAAEVTAEIPS